MQTNMYSFVQHYSTHLQAQLLPVILVRFAPGHSNTLQTTVCWTQTVGSMTDYYWIGCLTATTTLEKVERSRIHAAHAFP